MRWARQAALAACWLATASGAMAAGGHHGVDDAALLPSGACEQESWVSRARGGGRLLHAGVGCRVGPVELAAAAEHEHDGASATAWNLEVKWARELADGFSIGLDLQPGWQAHQHPRQAATQFSALATWSPRPDLNLHLNLGRDFVRGDADLPRHGFALEWVPLTGWSLLAERYLEERTHFLRAGARWTAGPQWTLDLSHAHVLRGPKPSLWTLGLTFNFGGE
jgi:hypothetical protein